MSVIQTRYANVYFRSRLEARWAVFFDALDIQWEYEKEGYEFSDGTRYLPDFWLPVQKRWIEIKGEIETKDEIGKASLLAVETMRPVHIFWGPIPDILNDEVPEYSVFLPEECEGEIVAGQDFPYLFGECPECGMFDIQYLGRADRFGCGCCTQKTFSYNSLHLLAAYQVARSARFEHGEKGAMIGV